MSVIFENQVCFSGEKLKFKIINEQDVELVLFQVVGEIFSKNVKLENFKMKGVGNYFYHSEHTFYSSKPYIADYTNCKVSVIMPHKLPPTYNQGSSFKIIYKMVVFFVYENEQSKQLQAPFIYFPAGSNNCEDFDFEKGFYFQPLAFSVQGIDSLMSPTSPRKLIQMIDALRNPQDFDEIQEQMNLDVFLDEVEQNVIDSDSGI
eukprot:NODE_124_length_17341_cov_0.560028.p9 type:complete len:204 gc:universal NODE_124_length_17341_cov_0.560028:12729-12118(-)